MKVYEIEAKNGRNRKTRTAAYCRVSTEKSEQSNSFEVQKMYFESKFKSSLTEELIGIYTDVASGTSICRPGFQKLIEDCRSGEVERIVTKSISRFGRNTRECLEIFRELKSIGVTVNFEKECIDTAHVSDEILITIMEGLAQAESESISRNTRWGIKRRMANGTLGIARVPYGYTKIDSSILIDEEKAKVVKRIFDLYLSGFGAKRIAAGLNEENIPSPTGTKWNNVTVLKILKQEKYIGDIRWQKTYSTFMGAKWKINHGEQDSYYIRDCLPAIISREDFAIVQQLKVNNTRQAQKTVASPFRGKTKCICGRSYSLKKGYKSIWECCGRYDLVKPCGCRSFPDENYNLAWNSMCRKLKQFADELIIPAIELFGQLEDSLIIEELSELNQRQSELSKKKYVMYSLCSEGCIRTEKLIEIQSGIDAEINEISRKRKMIEDQNEFIVDDLNDLYNIVITNPIEKFADKILVGAVSDGETIEFELMGGLRLKEEL